MSNTPEPNTLLNEEEEKQKQALLEFALSQKHAARILEVGAEKLARALGWTPHAEKREH